MVAAAAATVATTVGKTFRRFRDGVTIEPVVACYMTAFTMITLTVSNLNLQKACLVNLRLSDGTCDALMAKNGQAQAADEVAVQQLVTGMLLWQTIAQNALPCVLMLLVGSWSDRTRKRLPCMLLPIYGELARNIGQLVCVYYFRQLPMEAAGIAETIPIALTGGQAMLTMTAYSYIGDVTSAEHRTFRIGCVNAIMAISMAVGTSLSGIVYNKLGFYGAYGVSSALLAVGLAYGLLCVDDVPLGTKTDNDKPFRATVTEFFDMSRITQSLSTTFKPRPGAQRMKIIILLFILMTSAGTNYGFKMVAYLYTRVQFNWNELKYSVYATYDLIMNIIGLLFAVFVLSKTLKISDEIIGLMSTISQSLAAIFCFFAYNEILFYLGPLVNILVTSENMSIKSLMIKLVPKNEISQISAIFGITEITVSLIFGLIYNGLYEATLNTLPGAFYLVTFVFMAPSIALFIWMYVERRNDSEQLYEGRYASERSPRFTSNVIEKSDYGTILK